MADGWDNSPVSHPFLREFVEMHYLMTDPLIVDDSALQQLLGGITKTAYSEGVRRSLAAVGGREPILPNSAPVH
jgi:hypothetical protein